jgi:hypothetical protein
VALALLWLPVALLPVSNLLFPIGVLLAERTLYLPSAALAIGVTLVVAAGLRRGRPTSRATLALALLAALLLGGRTLRRIPEWRSTDAVFVSLLRDRPDSFYAHWHFGRAAIRRGDAAAGLASYGRALSLWPYRQRLIVEATGRAIQVGDTAFATRIITHGVRTWPGSLDIRRLAAGVALDRGDSATAALEVTSGLRIDSTDATLLRMREALGMRKP